MEKIRTDTISKEELYRQLKGLNTTATVFVCGKNFKNFEIVNIDRN